MKTAKERLQAITGGPPTPRRNWGGHRDGAGAKPKTKRRAMPKVAPKPEPPKASWFDSAAAARITEILQSRRGRQLPAPEMVFRPAVHPPLATPADKKLLMAMDSSLDWASSDFAGGGIAGAGVASAFAFEGLLFPGYAFLSTLAQRPEYRIISETIATECTRKWIKFKSTAEKDPKKNRAGSDVGAERHDDETVEGKGGAEPGKDPNDKTEKIKELTDFLASLHAQDRFSDAVLQDGFFGRSHLFLDFGEGEAEVFDGAQLKIPIGTGRDAASEASIRKGSLKALRNVEPVWVYPTTYNATVPLRADWYRPQVWYVMGTEIHRTRLLTFVGRPVPDMLKPAYSFGGLSLSQMAHPYVDIWLQTRQSVADLIKSFSVMVLMTDLATMTEPGAAQDLLGRADLFNVIRDNMGLFIGNHATEELTNVSAPLGGLHELQSQAQEHMASVARIPLVKFTGIEPSGLNASSEGSIRTFYDTIAAFQNKFMRPNLDVVVDIAQITLWGARDPDITYDFEPLHELTEKERSELKEKQAKSDIDYVNAGVLAPEEVRTRIANDPESDYHGINPDDVPEPPQEEIDGEEGGPVPPGGGAAAEPGEGAGKKVLPFKGGRDSPGPEDLPAEAVAAIERDRLGFLTSGGGPSLRMVADRDQWNGYYEPDDDSVTIERKGADKAPDAAVEILLHEAGHRGQYKVAPKLFAEFKRLRLARPEFFLDMANEAHIKDLERRGHVADMDGEVFAESYARWCLGWDLPEQLRAFWDRGAQAHDSAKEPEHTAVIKYDGDFDLGELLNHIGATAGVGHSFDVVVDPGDREHERRFGVDGDGADRIHSVEIDGEALALDAEWNESDHPRAPDGKFGSSGGTGGKAVKAAKGKIINTEALTKVSDKKGSNAGGVYKDDGGKEFYVKHLKSTAHKKNEYVAAGLYQLAGVKTLDYAPTSSATDVATEFAPLAKANVSKLNGQEIKKAQQDFAVHAWLANWDAVGTGGDNVGVVEKGGPPVVLDVGGSLDFRAQGDPKGAAFGTEVPEIHAMIDATKSPDGAKLYGNMTDAQMTVSAKRVADIHDDDIRATVAANEATPELAEKLIARKFNLAKAFGIKVVEEVEDPEFASKHPRNPDGTFKAGAGGEEAGDVEKFLKQTEAIKAKYGSGSFTTAEEKVKAAVKTGVMTDTLAAELTPVEKRELEKMYGSVQKAMEAGIEGAEHPDPEKPPPDDDPEHGEDPDNELTTLKIGNQVPAKSTGAPGPEAAAPGKKTAFGGLWKATPGENPAANFQVNAAHVLSKPANAGQSYRQMLAFMIKSAAGHGHEGLVPSLQAKLKEAWIKAHVKATAAGLTAEADKIAAKLKEFGVSTAPQASAEPAKGAEPSPQWADVKKFVPIYAQAVESIDASIPTAEKKAVMKIAAAVAGGNASFEAVLASLSNEQVQSLTKHGGVAKTFKTAQETANKKGAELAAPPAPKLPPPTAAELEKAKKNVAVKLQYLGVPDAPDTPVTQAILKTFNDKYEGKSITDQAGLIQKVNDFKAVQAAVAHVAGPEKAKALAAQQAATAKHAAEQEVANKAATAKLEETAKAAKAKNAEYMKALGISEVEATGFNALVGMLGESNATDLIAKFKSYQSAAEKLGYPISGFQYALIRNYIDGGYHAVNDALRSGSMSTAQHVYAKTVNSAIDKMPKHTGMVVRGTTLTAADIAKYKAGHVVREHAFTSTGIGFKFGGNVHYHIKSIGKRGADFSTGANTGEKEVLFKAGTFFLVHKVESKGGTTHIHMEEVEGHD